MKSGGVEVVTLSTLLNPAEAEQTLVSLDGGAFLGIRVATMASDGNLYLIEHPVARLNIDKAGRILSADGRHSQDAAWAFRPPAIAARAKRSPSNKQTPFVWAEEHYR